MKPTATRATRESLMDEFDTVVGETEKLLRSVAGASREQSDALRATLAERIADAGDRLERLRTDATGQAVAAVEATDEYVQDNPWRSVGIAAAAGALAGLFIGAWVARR